MGLCGGRPVVMKSGDGDDRWWGFTVVVVGVFFCLLREVFFMCEMRVVCVCVCFFMVKGIKLTYVDR